MATTETTVVYFARSKFSRDLLFTDGVNGTEEDYGMAQVCRVTKTTRRADGDVARILDKSEKIEVLFEVDTKGALHLLKTLSNAMASSLEVRPSYLERKSR